MSIKRQANRGWLAIQVKNIQKNGEGTLHADLKASGDTIIYPSLAEAQRSCVGQNVAFLQIQGYSNEYVRENSPEVIIVNIAPLQTH